MKWILKQIILSKILFIININMKIKKIKKKITIFEFIVQIGKGDFEIICNIVIIAVIALVALHA